MIFIELLIRILIELLDRGARTFIDLSYESLGL